MGHLFSGHLNKFNFEQFSRGDGDVGDIERFLAAMTSVKARMNIRREDI